MAESIFLETVTDGGEDSTGEPIPGESEWVEVAGCAVWIDATTDQLTVGEDKTITRFSVAVPKNTVVDADQRVRIRGREHAIDGDAFDWTNFYSGRTPGVVFHTKWVS